MSRKMMGAVSHHEREVAELRADRELAAVYHLGAERPAVEKVLAITRRVLKRKRFLLP